MPEWPLCLISCFITRLGLYVITHYRATVRKDVAWASMHLVLLTCFVSLIEMSGLTYDLSDTVLTLLTRSMLLLVIGQII